MQKYNSRKEVPEKYKWDLTSFFKDEKEYKETFKKTSKMIEKLRDYVGCTKDANRLYEFLKLQIETLVLWEDLLVYDLLIGDQEVGNAKIIVRKAKVEQLGAEFTNNSSFFETELLTLNETEYKKLFSSNPKLEEFKADLDRIYRGKEHALSEKEEIIINELVTAMNHFEDMSSNLLNSEHNYGKVNIDGETIEIATTNYRVLSKNKDEKIRKKVYTQFNKTIDQYSASSASYLNGFMAMNEKIAKLHHYKDSWAQKLFSLNLHDKVFKTLVRTVEENLSTLQRYYELKRHALGLEQLHHYDMNLDLVRLDKEYTIEEAQDLVRKAIAPLGKEYGEKYEKIITNRYIDYCQYKGKWAGGYSANSLNQDSRILMSFNGDLEAVSTIAHEAGHNVHYQYIYAHNPYQYRVVPSIVGEVTSLTNEFLLSSYLVEHGKTKEEKLAGLANILDVIEGNLFSAVREGKLEQEMYDEINKGGTITKEFMDKKTKSSLKKYYGSTVKLDKHAKNKWVMRHHYYMHYYLYSYSICVSIASSIASKILSGDKQILENYINFMKCGNDKWPSEIFAVLGVNVEDKQVYEDAIKYFDAMITKYYKIYEGEVK